jgi:hypothetical protein
LAFYIKKKQPVIGASRLYLKNSLVAGNASPAIMSSTRIIIAKENVMKPVGHNAFCVH